MIHCGSDDAPDASVFRPSVAMHAWEPGRHSYSLPRICPRIAGERDDVPMACRERQWQTVADRAWAPARVLPSDGLVRATGGRASAGCILLLCSRGSLSIVHQGRSAIPVSGAGARGKRGAMRRRLYSKQEGERWQGTMPQQCICERAHDGYGSISIALMQGCSHARIKCH